MTTSARRGDYAHAMAGDHRHLRTRLQQLQQSLAGAGLSNCQAEQELRRLERELDEHFADEECGGFFAEILAACPEFGHRVQRLVDQHREFREALRSLRRTCRLVCAESGARAGWLAAFSDFERCFVDHERAEQKLLLDATERDLGAGD